MALSILNNIAPTVVAHGVTTATNYYVNIEHNLGFVPDFVYVYNVSNATGYTHAVMYNSQYSTTTANVQYRYNNSTISKTTSYPATYGVFYLDETKCSMGCVNISYPWYTSANTTYWVAGKF